MHILFAVINNLTVKNNLFIKDFETRKLKIWVIIWLNILML